VVGPFRHGVFENGVQPQLGKTKVGDIVEVLADACNIPSVPAVGPAAIRRIAEAIDVVVSGIAVGKPVRRYQVNRVRARETAYVIRIVVALLYRVASR
jgi:hypothetical protein